MVPGFARLRHGFTKHSVKYRDPSDWEMSDNRKSNSNSVQPAPYAFNFFYRALGKICTPGLGDWEMSNWVQPAPYTFEFFYPQVNKKCWGQQAHLGKNTGTSMVNQFHDKCQLAMGSNFYKVLRKIRTWVIEKHVGGKQTGQCYFSAIIFWLCVASIHP